MHTLSRIRIRICTCIHLRRFYLQELCLTLKSHYQFLQLQLESPQQYSHLHLRLFYPLQYTII